MEVLFEAKEKTQLDQFQIVNDGVMGGKSLGKVSFKKEGWINFSGRVSTENNGGFTLLRTQTEKALDQAPKFVELLIKGDNKRYQFRIKRDQHQMHSHVMHFFARDQWETVVLPLQHFKATFRGKKMDLPPFEKDKVSEFGILIGNKLNQSFRLSIKSIKLI